MTPPPRGPPPPLAPRAKRTKEIEKRAFESERKGPSLEQVLEECLKGSRSAQELGWPSAISGSKGPQELSSL